MWQTALSNYGESDIASVIDEPLDFFSGAVIALKLLGECRCSLF